MLFRHTIVVARNFLTKFNMHLRIIDTHTHTHMEFSTDTFFIIMGYLPSLTTYVAWGDRQKCFLNRVAFLIH